MGRAPTTGRFESRAELCEWVRVNWIKTPAGITDIARQCRVSPGVVSKIIDTREGWPAPAPDALQACAADVAALYRTYAPASWWIDRMFNMEFVCDQLLDGTMNEAFARSSDRDLLRYGLIPSHL